MDSFSGEASSSGTSDMMSILIFVVRFVESAVEYLGDKRVGIRFVAYGGRLAMPGVDFHVASEWQKIVEYAMHQHVVIAARQIGTANAAAKQRIAAEQDARLFDVETYAAL